MLQASKTPEQFPDNAEKKITHVTMMKDTKAQFKLTKGIKQMRRESEISAENLPKNPRDPDHQRIPSTSDQFRSGIFTF